MTPQELMPHFNLTRRIFLDHGNGIEEVRGVLQMHTDHGLIIRGRTPNGYAGRVIKPDAVVRIEPW